MVVDDRVEPLGSANPGTQLSTGRVIDGTLYVATRSVRPFTVIGIDLGTMAPTAVHELDIGDGDWPVTGVGAQASATDGDDLYLGVYGVGELYRLPSGGELSRIASLPDSWFAWDLAAAADGTLYAGSYPGSAVYAYDPADGSVTDLGPAHPDEDYARAVAVDRDTLYVGAGGKQARLVAIDRGAGDRTDILPSGLEGRSMVDAIVRTNAGIVASVRGRDRDTLSALAVIDPNDPDRHRIVETEHLVRLYGIAARDDRVYVAGRELRAADTATVLARFDPSDGTLTRLPFPRIDVGCCALSAVDDRLVGVDDYGAVWTFHVETGEYDWFDLADIGVEPREELPQSITACGDRPVVAGHRKVHGHDIEGETYETSRLPGEAKAMTTVGERTYAAVYKHAFFVAFGPGPGEPSILAEVGHEQTRPRSLHYHEAAGLVLMGTVPDSGTVGGAVAAFDPETGDLAVDRGVVPGQSIRRITAIGDTAYLASERRGGGGSDPGDTEARLVAWDPIAPEVRWECIPVPDTRTIVDVVPASGTLFGVTASGESFTVDPDTRETIGVDRLQIADGEAVGALAVVDDRVYGVTDRRLYRVDPSTRAVTTLLDGLDSTWYNEPMIAVDDRDRLYIVDDYRLVRVSVS